MQKINLTIDVTKINKAKIIPRTYINKGGVEVTVKDLNLEVVPLKEKKFIKETPKGNLYKTHFVAHKSIKNEDGTYENGEIIGDGISFEAKESAEEHTSKPSAGDNDFNIPF
jgi:hypothetical protein